ncbi:MAG: hypothetical protein J2P53_09395 [Bradyrhizobiaceae bacterium]|nr:hypothetical protein [Bradyrhizobiaceae bacterium]
MPDWRHSAVLAATLLAAQFTATHAQEMSKFPDWSGQWRRPAGVAAAWDPTRPPGLGQEAPLTPEYQAIFEAILKDRAEGGLTGDPTGLCLPHGMPRMMVAIFPVEFVITPNITYYLTDYTTPRRIFTDGRPWPKDLRPSFNGYSIGKWVDTDGDGRYDLLEVETRGFKSPRTFEGSGLPLHRDGESVIRERIFIDPADSNLLHDEVTVTDQRTHAPVDGDAALSARTRRRMGFCRLRREQSPCGDRRRDVHAERRWPADAHQGRPAAARPALF